MLIHAFALDRASGILAFAARVNMIAYLLVRKDCPGIGIRQSCLFSADQKFAALKLETATSANRGYRAAGAYRFDEV
jgi:hypothetical protein